MVLKALDDSKRRKSYAANHTVNGNCVYLLECLNLNYTYVTELDNVVQLSNGEIKHNKFIVIHTVVKLQIIVVNINMVRGVEICD